MAVLREVTALVLVGAFWGCTNPFLRKGSTETIANGKADRQKSTTLTLLVKFRHFQVWLPFVINQTGSVLFYYTLSSSDLSLAVPICNALALIFSVVTSYMLGERVDKPLRAIMGAALVTGGVCLCLNSGSN